MKVNNLTYKVGDKTIISDINLELDPGGFYILLGRNGSGKTTLLRAMSKSIPVENQKVYISGQDINTLSPKQLAKSLAVVPQHTEFLFDFSSYQIVMMGRMPYQKLLQSDTKEDLRIVQESMERTNTWHLRNRSIKQLSGGELQRVIIARALSQTTPTIFLDEPISNLDIKHQYEIMDMLKEINQDYKIRILLILHDLNLAYQYAQDIMIMEEGRLVHSGPKQEILTQDNINDLFGVRAEIIDNTYINIRKK